MKNGHLKLKFIFLHLPSLTSLFLPSGGQPELFASSRSICSNSRFGPTPYIENRVKTEITGLHI